MVFDRCFVRLQASTMIHHKPPQPLDTIRHNLNVDKAMVSEGDAQVHPIDP